MGLDILDEWQAASLEAHPVGNASLDSPDVGKLWLDLVSFV
jgi:hypothetical protein